MSTQARNAPTTPTKVNPAVPQSLNTQMTTSDVDTLCKPVQVVSGLLIP